MVLVFILLGIIIAVLLIFTILLLSKIQIEIKNLKIGNKEENRGRIKDKYEVKITLYFLKKIPILWFRLNDKKIRKISNSKQLEKIDLKALKDIKYKNMLRNQIRWINQNELRIHNRARNLYYLVLNGHTTEELLRRCCNFRLLEKKCDDFMRENGVNEEEILYYFSA